MSWKSVTSLLNITHPPLYLKMDIEGFEWEVLSEIASSSALKPQQIAVELHYGWNFFHHGDSKDKSSSELMLLMDSIYRNGNYFVVDRHDNVLCDSCTEILLSRIC